jgi:hypothetical protein
MLNKNEGKTYIGTAHNISQGVQDMQATGITGAFAVHSKNSHLLNWSKSKGHCFVPLIVSFIQYKTVYTTDMQMLTTDGNNINE